LRISPYDVNDIRKELVQANVLYVFSDKRARITMAGLDPYLTA
jgi:hypothetical protein